MACTAYLVCFICTVNGPKKKSRLARPALVAGTQQTLSNLFWRLSISVSKLYALKHTILTALSKVCGENYYMG